MVSINQSLLLVLLWISAMVTFAAHSRLEDERWAFPGAAKLVCRRDQIPP
jgi:hypothetical protein